MCTEARSHTLHEEKGSASSSSLLSTSNPWRSNRGPPSVTEKPPFAMILEVAVLKIEFLDK